jgi:hypothetical protein
MAKLSLAEVKQQLDKLYNFDKGPGGVGVMFGAVRSCRQLQNLIS